jgi:NADP-dependent 3-hydroxy acid dehydrogenase YdfG
VTAPFAVVVGAGPGVGAAFARRLAAEGYEVGLVARDGARLGDLALAVGAGAAGIRTAVADVADADDLARAVEDLVRDAGRLDVLHYNPSQWRPGGVPEVSAADLLDDLAVGAAGLLTAVRAGLTALLDRGGTVTATGSGAADRPTRGGLTLGVQKAALRALVRGLAAELAPQGVHVGTVTVRGTIKAGTALGPEAVADALYGLVAETPGPPDTWTTELELSRTGPSRLA